MNAVFQVAVGFSVNALVKKPMSSSRLGRFSLDKTRRVIALLAIVTLVSSLFVCPPANAARQQGPLKQVVRVGGDYDYPPYESLDANGQPVGFNIDLMRAVGEVMGFDVEFRLGPWDQARQELMEGKIDVLPMYESPLREELVDFSDAHTLIFYEIFTRINAKPIRSLEELNGRDVIVQRDALMHDYLRKNDVGARLTPVESEPEALRLLASGKHDCALVSQIGGRDAIRRYKLTNLTTAGPPQLPSGYAFAVEKNNKEMLGQINQGLAILKATGRYREIHDKWFAELMPDRTNVLLRYAAWVLVVLVLVLVAAVAWTWSLRKQVAARTAELQTEIAERRRAMRFQKGRNKVLERLAAGATLEEVFTILVETVESLSPEMIGSVLMLDKNTQCLHHGAAPRLPDFYNKAIDGIRIGRGVGSCGTTAFLGERVVVADIMTHPYWIDFRDVAARAGLRACWSEPVLSSTGEVLGTFAMYYREPREPVESDLDLIKTSSHLAGIAIEHKRAEEEIKMLNAELEQRVKHRTAQLEAVNRELEAFTYSVSHDLQEPLRRVISYLQFLEEDYRGKLDGKADEFIRRASGGALWMRTLIRDLLSYSRAGTQSKPFQPTDCAAVLNAAIDNLDSAIKESGAVVTRDGLPTVTADSTQLVQLFQNLIGNAIKFHGEQPPRIHISAERKDGDWLFSVRDNGIGIDPEHHERVFAIFERLDTESKRPGTGVGLAVCKKIVERHAGRIWVESTPGQGSTFFFTIPSRDGVAQAAQEPVDESAFVKKA